MRHLTRFLLVLLAAAFLSACAVSPFAPDNKSKSDALLQQQIARATVQITQDVAPRLIYVGVAMDDQSTAFAGDVLLAASVAQQIDPQALVFSLNNPAPGGGISMPFSTRDNLEAVLKAVGSMARPQDKLMLLFSSHGAPGKLSLHAGQAHLGFVTEADLLRWLQPLKTRSMLLLISSCSSGSFIAPLHERQRIILTAAAKDRSSFGCTSRSDNTFFVKALLGQPDLLKLSLQEAMARALVGVTALESQMHLTPPSEPQASYGLDALAWSNQAIGHWLTSP